MLLVFSIGLEICFHDGVRFNSKLERHKFFLIIRFSLHPLDSVIGIEAMQEKSRGVTILDSRSE